MIVMKTIEEMYKEIDGSEELQNKLEGVQDNASIEAFLKEYDCGATAEEFKNFVKSKRGGNTEGEISDDDVEAVAGGRSGGFFDFWPFD